MEPLPPTDPGEVATRWRYRDGAGEIGIIASVTQPFCGTCTRARLTAEGLLYTCLFGVRGHDLRARCAAARTTTPCAARLAAAWGRRDRSLLGAPLGGDGGAAQGRDVTHRRLR